MRRLPMKRFADALLFYDLNLSKKCSSPAKIFPTWFLPPLYVFLLHTKIKVRHGYSCWIN